MARPLKHTIDYFPHFVNAGKTLLILQNEFGNDGYAFWFKLLSLLCKTDRLVYDYNNAASWKLLLAETAVNEDTANKILQLLSDIQAIDPDLHQSKVIWVQNLVDNLSDVFSRRRNGSVPEKPVIDDINPVIVNINPVIVNRNRQTRPDQTKQDKTILSNQELLKNFDVVWKAYPKKKSRGQAEKAFCKIKPDEQLLATMLAMIERAKKSEDWLKEGGKYIPYPATWLNAKGWEDEYKEEHGAHRNSRDLPKTYTPSPDDYPELQSAT